MKQAKSALYLFSPSFARTVVYMLQAVEYRPSAYLRWFWRSRDFSKITYRKELVYTRPSRMLLAGFLTGELVEIAAGISLLSIGLAYQDFPQIAYGVGLLAAAPIIWAHLVILPLVFGDLFIIKPVYGAKVRRSAGTFAGHEALKIAIAGSYGKTTMKEILLTVLSEGKNVKATPANRNVPISHAQFARSLKGDEDILIIEYGEGAPGDVARFAKITHPDTGVITGLAPAHLDRYKTLKAAGRDIFSLSDYLGGKEVYVNGESEAAKPFIKNTDIIYSAKGVGSWKAKGIKSTIQGLSFTIGDKNHSLKLASRLLGRHQVGPLSLAAHLGHRLGLSDKQIEAGIAKIEPFEHRMHPYKLSGAWVIDDTYNGNIEGMLAGLKLLKELPAKRKIYVTPGLVDQGPDERTIHRHLGEAIVDAKPDKVILMKHSVTDSIIHGMAGYEGELKVEDDPLNFYTNLDKFVAAGDLVLMQNDWPDQYS